MKFGSREICDVVFKAKSTMKVGNKVFYRDEPVMYFDTLKTSTFEQAVTPVYAQGGKGNARLVAWEGDKTVTFTMEDALISAEGLMILASAGLVQPTAEKPVYQHITETTIDFEFVGSKASSGPEDAGTAATSFKVWVEEKPYLPTGVKENYAYVMMVKNGEILSEPFIPVPNAAVEADSEHEGRYPIELKTNGSYHADSLVSYDGNIDSVIVDYYTAKESGVKQIEIYPESFGGNFYIEASTLFRNTDGVDLPAEFIIPNARVQSNFSMAMAPSGDPSTFTFTMDAFPDFTRFDKSKKVLAAIQVIEEASGAENNREATWAQLGAPEKKYPGDGAQANPNDFSAYPGKGAAAAASTLNAVTQPSGKK